MDPLGSSRVDALVGQAQAAAAQAHVRGVASGDEARSPEDLQRAAEEFEGVFLNTLLKAMRETVPENELFNGGGATRFYQQMHDAELARALAAGHDGMGIAELIIRQLDSPEAKGGEADAAPPAPALPPTRLGPPAPVAVARYRELLPQSASSAGGARLRHLSSRANAAESDTLRMYGDHLNEAAAAEELDPALVLAVVMEESGGDAAAVSGKGARGLMQLMPGTAEEVGVRDSLDAGENLRGGSRYLARMVRRFGGRLDLALAAYNAGPARVERAGRRIPDIAETRNYVARVLERYRNLGGGTEMDTIRPYPSATDPPNPR